MNASFETRRSFLTYSTCNSAHVESCDLLGIQIGRTDQAYHAEISEQVAGLQARPSRTHLKTCRCFETSVQAMMRLAINVHPFHLC